jgi:hypothetical protein
VSWRPDPNDESNTIQLGTLVMHDLQASHKRAILNQTTQFTITNTAAFGTFTQSMITSPNFTWVLQSDDLKVQALKFPTAHGIHFNKVVTLNGKDVLFIQTRISQ